MGVINLINQASKNNNLLLDKKFLLFKQFLLFFYFLFSLFCGINIVLRCNLAYADDLKAAASIAASGMKLQSERIKIATENLANEGTTSTIPGGDPYRRKVIYAENKFDKRLKGNRVAVAKVDFDKSDFDIRFDPKHPAADINGYVKYPNVNKTVELYDSSEASRSYEANLGAMEISKSLMQKTIDTIR